MDYRIKKNQIFKKQLPVPNHIRLDVYNCKLSFEDYIRYKLDDKVPISCLEVSDREIVERFGLERAKELDWSILSIGRRKLPNIKEIILRIPKDALDINDTLYKTLSTTISPQNYSAGMRKKYPNREITIDESDSRNLQDVKQAFNMGCANLKDIVKYWEHFKDRDFTYLLSSAYLDVKITNEEFKEFMSNFKHTAGIISNYKDLYILIRDINDSKDENEKVQKLKDLSEEILRRTNANTYEKITLTNEQYKELFRYTSMKDFLIEASNREMYVEEMYKDLELDGLTPEILLETDIPFEELKNSDVLYFIRTYGYKNVIEFDKECGHFFTKNDCYLLKKMFDIYMHYAINDHNENTSFFTRRLPVDSEGNEIYRPYTKDEFYEAMRRMVIGGPTDGLYRDKAPDYREMTGEFKKRNNTLFLDSSAPEELKTLFYTKSLTPGIIRKNQDFIPYLEGKELSSCFKPIYVLLEEGEFAYDSENLYSFLLKVTDYKNAFEFITEYGDSLKLLNENNSSYYGDYSIRYKKTDDFQEVIRKTNDLIVKLLVEKHIPYPENLPKDLFINHPEMFLSNDAPKELQKAFYGRTIKTSMLIENPNYKEYLKGKNLELLFKFMPVSIRKPDEEVNLYTSSIIEHKNIVKIIEEEFESDALDVLIEYGKYLENLYEINGLNNITLNVGYTKDNIKEILDKAIYEGIINNGLVYDENISQTFKDKYPEFFLNENVPQDIKDKFYNRKLTVEDFNNNKELIDIFDKTNILCGFTSNISWLIPVIKGDNHKINNLNRLKIMTEYSKIQDMSLQNVFKEYICKYKDNINIETITYIAEVLHRLALSNSQEMYVFRNELAYQILDTPNPIESLNKVENIFIKNNIPTVGKTYSCFEILHPNFKGFNMESSTISPTLKTAGNMKRKYIVFNDLIKAAFGSNNQSINKYVENLDKGYKLYRKVQESNISFDNLSEDDKETLIKFRRILSTLYEKTLRGRTSDEISSLTDDVVKDIENLEVKLSENGEVGYNLANRVISMFCGGAGIKTVEEAQEYVYKKISQAEKRNIEASQSNMVLEKGDLVKGINELKYLRNILQNGSVSKEYLGSSAGSDATPLDTDVSMVLMEGGTVSDRISSTVASGYGNIWLVLRNDGRFKTTRDGSEIYDETYDKDKLELFHTGVLGAGHYGIRTGFASSEINYIVTDKYDTRIGLEIALNGFYIPVADKEGKIVFTYDDYKKIRDKMAGLSYYDQVNYTFSENLVTVDTKELATKIEESNKETNHKREVINKKIKEALQELGLTLKTSIDGDLTPSYVELIDTGSTGRGTNKPGDGDFDFMMRLDRSIMTSQKKLNELKEAITTKLGIDRSKFEIGTGDFRIKGITIDDVTVDIDISFVTKTDSIRYSTDMALQDKLETIKKQDPKKYNYVVANILLAKQVLKEGKAYKPNRGDNPEGGLGGVGIENWILQHGGSFIDAAKSFVKASEGKSFEDFLHTYEVWDFGENHFAEKRGKYIHDEFVSNNMSREGFIKMRDALQKYLKELEKQENLQSTYQM